VSNNVLISYYKVVNTIYVIVRNQEGEVWNTSSKTFEQWNDLDIASYVINTSYKEGLLYTVDFPSEISNGYYIVMIFLQGGGSPNIDTDIWLGTSTYYWDKDNNNLVGVRVDTLVEYSSGERFVEKSLETVKKLNVDHDTESVVLERESNPSTITILRESNPSTITILRESNPIC